MAAGNNKLIGTALAIGGLIFILVAVVQPAFLWEMGKVQQGREWFGDTGVAVVFGVFGCILSAVGLVLALRKK